LTFIIFLGKIIKVNIKIIHNQEVYTMSVIVHKINRSRAESLRNKAIN